MFNKSDDTIDQESNACIYLEIERKAENETVRMIHDNN